MNSLDRLSLCFSLADQDFHRTSSIGILNFSLQLAAYLSRQTEVGPMHVLANSGLTERLDLTPGTVVSRYDQATRSRWGRVRWDQSMIYSAAVRSGCDWLILPKGFAPMRRRSPVKLACCLHDTILEHYREKYPRSFSTGKRWYFHRGLLATLRHADVIACTSHFTADEVRRVADQNGIRPPAIHPIGIGFEPPPEWPAGNRTDQILVFASPLPHKRTREAIDFMARWQQQTGSMRPVHWVGRLPKDALLPEFANWTHHARLEESAFRKLLARSRVSIYTTDYEGFGMPPVESVLSACAPVYSEIAATKEVMRGRGFPFQNGQFDSFAAALESALQSEPAQLQSWTSSLIADYSWEKTVEALVRILQVRS